MASVLQVPTDVEEVLIQGLLRPSADIQAVFDTRISAEVPPDPVYPLARVKRLGGALTTSRFLWLDRARVQIDVWGDTRKATWRAANLVRSVLIAGQCTTYAPLGRIDSIDEIIGPFEGPDSDKRRRHYIAEYEVLVRPIEVTS